LAAFTRWVLSHKLLVVAFWVIVTVVGGISSSSAVNALSQQFSVPGREGFETNQTILKLYRNDSIDPPIVAVATLPAGTTAYSPGIKSQITAAFAHLGAGVPGSRIMSYGTTANRAFVSRDGRTIFGVIYPPYVSFTKSDSLTQSFRGAAAGVTIAGVHLHISGLDPLASSSGGGTGPGVLIEALLGGVGALLVLIFVFRSFMALMPLLMAIVAIPTTFLLVWALTVVTDVSFIVQFLVALIGLGVAIDYALIIVMRWREEHAGGLDNEAAVQRAMETAGRAVIFSGSTVAIGLLALVVLPVPFLQSVGYGGMLIPLVSVAVALTLLPVLLATVGPRLDWPRIGEPGGYSPFWVWWARLIVRRRWIAGAVGAAILIGLLAVATTISLGQTKADALSKSGDAYQGLVALERSGIGVGVFTPFEVLDHQSNPAALSRLLSQVQGVRGTVTPGGPSWRRAGTSLVEVFPIADGSSSAGKDTLDRVRQLAHSQPGNPRVGGEPASNVDFISAVYGSFPLMIVLIALITFLLLARAFRSLILPLKAVILNVFSVGAAWGVIDLIWQQGYGSKPIWGITSTGSITAWIPLMVFAFLFGLSMDYEVFILTRMREEYDATGNTSSAIVTGIGRTGRLVTSAALILGLAFIALASGPQTDIKVLGTGLAAGILLDATVVRMLLVPAVVSLLGRWNWWLPALPARLLRVQPSLLSVRKTVEA
jgi:putative drug exporter of the RND superfamily